MKGSRHRELIAALEKLAVQVVTGLGLELVELTVRGSSRRRVVRVDIDRAGPRGVNIDDCQRVSGALGGLLESEERFDASYVLEVSSPGIDRPICTADDFRRNTGRRVEVTTNESIDGRKHFVGLLTGFDEERILLDEDGSGPVEIALGRVASTRQDVGF